MKINFVRWLGLGLVAVASIGAQAEELSDERPLSDGLHRFNIQTSPVAMMARRYNASFEAGVTQGLALGLKGTSYPQPTVSGFLDTTTGYEIGGRATWNVTSDRFTSGLILRSSLYYKHTQTRHDFTDAIGNALVKAFTLGLASSDGVTVDVVNGPAYELMGGYQVVFERGFNFDWNVGMTTYQQYSKVVNLKDGSEKVYESKKWHINPVVELNIGYAF